MSRDIDFLPLEDRRNEPRIKNCPDCGSKRSKKGYSNHVVEPWIDSGKETMKDVKPRKDWWSWAHFECGSNWYISWYNPVKNHLIIGSSECVRREHRNLLWVVCGFSVITNVITYLCF